MKQIYLDYASTTPTDERVANEMYNYLKFDGCFGNPASDTHFYGWEADKAVSSARNSIAGLLNASVKEVVFTSGATEANNLAIKGVASAYVNKGKHIITCKTEHKSVLDTCLYLESIGYDVTYLTPTAEGLIDLSELENSIREDTILVTIMYINNELGVIQPIKRIGEICRRNKVLFHVDAAQAVGKIKVDVQEDMIDMLSLSGGKIYGPKGIGALYVKRRPRVKINPQIHGGGHEFGFRSGTLATHQIVGLGVACQISQSCMDEDRNKLIALRECFLRGVKSISGLVINGSSQSFFPGIVNLTIPGIDGEAFMMAMNGVAFSAGSACNSASIEPSYVLLAIGVTPEDSHASFRISFGRYTEINEVSYVADLCVKHVEKLRCLSPIWTKKGE
jgi:cysteine desulfurase